MAKTNLKASCALIMLTAALLLFPINVSADNGGTTSANSFWAFLFGNSEQTQAAANDDDGKLCKWVWCGGEE